MSKFYTLSRKAMYVILGKANEYMPFLQTKLFILCYHSISSDGWEFAVPLEEFKKQITYLSKRYAFVTLSDLTNYFSGKTLITKPSVVITFDDGYKDVLQTISFLKSKKIKPTMFLISDTQHADRKELATQRPFLKKEEVKSLIKNGWEIGSHTATHANMDTLTDKEITAEIINSKKTLEKELHMSIPYLAYPKGKYNKKVLQAVKKAKYTLALTMDDGIITNTTNIYKIPRVGVDGTHSFEEFKTLFLPFNIFARKILKLVL